ncbi:MAG: DUF1616 domain-containing protein [Candidatus Bathyarchaeota archaeon]|nr:DUF1616 domain-containing protein [Candidatus Bathyarchaeota archaeon]
MSAASKDEELAQIILRVTKEKQPQTTRQLVTLVKDSCQFTEKVIVESILKLQSEGKIKLSKQPPQTPPQLNAYLQTGQALWFWATLTTTFVTAAAVFTISEDLYPWVYIRYVLGTIFVLWLPGYSFIKALFPVQVPIKLATENLDLIERVALSLGMSLALVPLVGLLLNYTPWGIRLTPIVLSLLALTVAFATVAVVREHQARIEKGR